MESHRALSLSVCVFLYVYHTSVKNTVKNATGEVDSTEEMAVFQWEGQPTSPSAHSLCSLMGRTLQTGLQIVMSVDAFRCNGDPLLLPWPHAIVRTSKTNCWLRYSPYEKNDQQIYCLTSFPLKGTGPVVLFQSSIVGIYLLYRTLCTIKRSNNLKF